MGLNSGMKIEVTTVYGPGERSLAEAIAGFSDAVESARERWARMLRETPYQKPDRPGNGWPGRRPCQDLCGGRRGGWTCAALAQHSGDHMAYGTGGILYHQWPQDDERPGNGFEPEGGLICRDYDPAGKWVCTARRGHAGDHMSWPSPDARYPDASWPQRPGNDYEPDGKKRCLDEMISHPDVVQRQKARAGHYWYVCYAAKGHAGDHIGWYPTTNGGADHAADAVWPQD